MGLAIWGWLYGVRVDFPDRLEEIGCGGASVNPSADCFTGSPANECFAYDGNSNITQHQTRKLDVIAFAYDNLNRRTTKTPPSPAPVVSYAYDLAGRLIGAGITVTLHSIDRGRSRLCCTLASSGPAWVVPSGPRG
jgi:hypothetical protein